jgi:hypothetical protein
MGILNLTALSSAMKPVNLKLLNLYLNLEMLCSLNGVLLRTLHLCCRLTSFSVTVVSCLIVNGGTKEKLQIQEKCSQE